MFGAALGAVGSVASAFIAADAQNTATHTNWAIALMNYYARERERWEAKLESRRLETKQNEGFTDAQGNRTSYVPGKGYVVNLSPESEALQDRIYAEQMQRLGPDAQMRRHQLQRNEIRQIEENDKARALFDQMRKLPRKKADVIENLLFNAASTGINRAFDDTTAVATRQALRTKSSNAGKLLEEIAKQRSEAVKGARTQSRVQAMEMAPALNAATDKQKADLYNMFATRASQMPETPFAPPNVGGSAEQLLQVASNNNRATGELQLKAAMMEGGRLPFVPPNYGTANAVGAAGTSLSALFKQMGGPSMFAGSDEHSDERYRGNQGIT